MAITLSDNDRAFTIIKESDQWTQSPWVDILISSLF